MRGFRSAFAFLEFSADAFALVILSIRKRTGLPRKLSPESRAATKSVSLLPLRSSVDRTIFTSLARSVAPFSFTPSWSRANLSRDGSVYFASRPSGSGGTSSTTVPLSSRPFISISSAELSAD